MHEGVRSQISFSLTYCFIPSTFYSQRQENDKFKRSIHNNLGNVRAENGFSEEKGKSGIFNAIPGSGRVQEAFQVEQLSCGFPLQKVYTMIKSFFTLSAKVDLAADNNAGRVPVHTNTEYED